MNLQDYHVSACGRMRKFYMSDPIVLTQNDSILESLDFRPYRSKVERRVIPFVPSPDEPQTMEVNTPWGAQLTAQRGDFLIS